MNRMSTGWWLLAVPFLFSACGGSGSTDREAGAALPGEFREAYGGILDRYFELAEVLTESDAESAARESALLADRIDNAADGALRAETAGFWEEHRTVLLERARAMAGLDDVEEQRYQYEYLSESLIRVADRFGTAGREAYVQRCPMVRGGSADWLSRRPEIRNPYHGDRMMNCGRTVRKIYEGDRI